MDSLDIDLERAETAASRQISLRRSSASSTSSRQEYARPDVDQDATQMSRWQSQRLQHIHTVGSSRSRAESVAESKPLPGFGAGKPYPPNVSAQREAYVVDFDGPEDALHPMNWPARRK